MYAVDLFAGAGGMSVGALKAGIVVKYSVEIDIHAATTYKSNHHKTNVLVEDIKEISFSNMDLDRSRPVIVFGGPPCQGFSTSNQRTRSLNNNHNWLFREYLRAIGEIKPQWVVFENVRGILETEKGIFADEVISGLEALGYATSCFLLNAMHYGVPQNRERFFVVGSIDGIRVDEPPRTCSFPLAVKDAFVDLPILENGASLSERSHDTRKVNNFINLMRGNMQSSQNHLVTRNAQYVIERYKYIPQGGNWEYIPSELMTNYKNRFRCHTGIYRRLKEDEPSVVIGNYRKNMLIHPTQDRGLSVREAARLQSFPDDFVFKGSIGFQQQQVGNAVPPLLAQALFTQILKYEDRRK